MRVFLASSERFAGCILAALHRAGHEVVGVASPAKGIYARGFDGSRFWRQRLRGWDILDACRRYKTIVRVSRQLGDGAMRAFIRQTQADVLVLFGWPTLVDQETLALFPMGGMNIHPSMLPSLRGPDPLFEIVDQKLHDQFGLTFHKAIDALDAGPIYHQIRLPFSGGDVYDDLYIRVLNGIYGQIATALNKMSERPEGAPQQGQATTAGRFRPSKRVLDTQQDLDQIRRRTLACNSHHTRLFSSDGRLFHFSKCDFLENYEGKFDGDGVVQEARPFSLVVRFGDRFGRLSKIRIEGKPWWLTPYYLIKSCPPGSDLDTYAVTRALMKQTHRI